MNCYRRGLCLLFSMTLVVALFCAASPLSAQTGKNEPAKEEFVQSLLNYEVPPVHCAAEDERVPVLLLGSYHMANPGADMFNLEADDVLSPQRQKEIEKLVTHLAQFRPTKIAVEAPFSDSATVAHYQQYLDDDRTLKRNESEQIGFRLAKKMGHPQVYPIDVKMSLGFDDFRELASKSPEHEDRLAELQQFGQAAITIMARWLSEGSVMEMLYKMNRPEFLQLSHESYFRFFMPVVKGENYAGANLIANWYHRNAMIFSNLHKITDSAQDRILVVYGQGHVPILRDLVEDSPYFCVVDPLTYLSDD